MSARLLAIQRNRFLRAVWALVVNLDRYAAPRAASAMAFDLFLSLIPLVAGAGVVLHRLHSTSATTLGPLLKAIPPDVAAMIDGEFLRLSDAGFKVFAPLVLVAFAWVSSAGLSTALGVFECIYIGTERPWYKRRLIAMAYVFSGLVVVTVVTAVGLWIASKSSALGWILGFCLPVVAPVLLVAAFFRIATQRRGGPKRRVLPGAILTVALWAATSTAFSFYVGKVASYATLYGNLATVAIALLWLWLASIALLVGGEVNALLDGVGLDDAPESVFPFHGHEDDLPGEDMRPPATVRPDSASRSGE
ncbi:MAG: YihY/virulence factor BrkB family protein [Polyangiaceae bacterium]|nr:YihY/virulence factor BrkB family protein [Polyangiaceae bacterium]